MFRMTSYLCYLLGSLLLLSCNSHPGASQKETATVTPAPSPKTDTKYVNGIQLTSPARDAILKYNDLLKITFDTKKGLPVDSVEIFWNNRKITTIRNEKEYQLRVPSTQTGRNNLKLMAFHPEEKRSLSSVTVTVKPDKAPEKLQ